MRFVQGFFERKPVVPLIDSPTDPGAANTAEVVSTSAFSGQQHTG
jgi:hypothetical protein